MTTTASPSVRPRRRAHKATRRGQTKFIISFLALPVALYIWLVVMPFVQTFQLSFTDWSGASPTFNYIGIDNYVDMWDDDSGMIIPGFIHTALMLVIVPIVVIGLAMFFAFMLNVGGRAKHGRIAGVSGSKIYKVIYFFPQVMSLAIVAIIWREAYNPASVGGLVASLLKALGLPYPENGFIYTAPLTSVMIVLIWSVVGFYLVYFSAAMASIPTELYEAALIDGASRVKTFFKITFPLLWDSVQTAWVYLGIMALDGFVLVFTMTPEQGGPNHASEVVGGVIYKYAWGDQSNAGMASAIGVVLFLFMMIMTLLFLRLTRRERIEF
ncbi:MAG TPA: sugar ABC transporter permease [Stackebrandtia sp.]|jgi:N-acetylglucosamine transport system permease protein|uniref:carbohydrate ABC transporter permease n=1 Tax=Stackebrandtia sp. TaxID=2023065 RepID=UPI002D455A6F|nr:sugar ABC transporter permease [Stackebrandtia sp.]HZE40917.1 sugar ABC transporter permease [Stackebrandtia sp.]